MAVPEPVWGNRSNRAGWRVVRMYGVGLLVPACHTELNQTKKAGF
jgi:hypothetical protein